jgi:hypothetical protein
MVGTFLRHGSNVWLAFAVAALVVCSAAGVFPFYLLWALIGALAFYGSEYGFHRFAFHAGPSRFAFVRKLQHRLHYDHHAEPDRLDLLFLPVWFLVPNLAVTALIFALAFGSAVVASAMLGVTFAILHYEWVHYVARYSLSAAHADRALDQAISPAPSLHQREVLVRRQQSGAGPARRHVPPSARRCPQHDHPQAFRRAADDHRFGAAPRILRVESASLLTCLLRPCVPSRHERAQPVRSRGGHRHADLLRGGGSQPLVRSRLRGGLRVGVCVRLFAGRLAVRPRGGRMGLRRGLPLAHAHVEGMKPCRAGRRPPR